MSKFIGGLVAEFSAAEREGFEGFRKTYEELNPRAETLPPEKDQELPLLSWANVDLLLLIAKAVFTVSLSALRTAGMFAGVVQLEDSSTVLSWVIAVLVVGSVEIGIVIYAIYAAYRGQLAGEKREHLATDRAWIFFSTIFALILMIGANGLKSLPVLTVPGEFDPRPLLEQMLLVAMGIGVPMMAFIDGRFIGIALGAWLVHNQTIESRHIRAVNAWREGLSSGAQEYYAEMRAAWESSEQYAALARQFKTEQAAARRQAVEPVHQVIQALGPSMLDKAYEWLTENKNGWHSIDDLPSTRELQGILEEEYGEPFPPSSVHKARVKFAQNL